MFTLKTKIDRLALQQSRHNVKQNIIITPDHQIQFVDGSISYKPEPTPLLMHQDDSLVRLIVGPYRSGKSVGCCAEIIFRACAMAPSLDGIRRCRVGVIRNTYADLQDTVLQTWLDWYGNLGEVTHHKHPRIFYKYRFNDGKGIVDLELMFLALDREKDIRKLKSLEVTYMYVNEFSEIPFGFLSHFIGRTGCYPPPIMCVNPYWRGVFMDTNAPNLRHPIRQVFEIDKPNGYKFFRQPPAIIKKGNEYIINPNAENVKNLPENYYLDLIKGATEEFIKVYAMGDYGSVFTGKVVYPNYNDDLHSIDKLEIVDNKEIIVAIDFGLYTPAALLMQAHGGQLRVFKEFVTHDLGTRELVETVVLPYLRQHFGHKETGFSITVIRDPAGQKKEVDILEELGLPSDIALTNDLLPRLDAVNWYLNRMSGGQPAIVIDREGCPTLREGFLGGYNYKKVAIVGDERFRDEPDKNFFSHIHDCLQYGALKARGRETDWQPKEEETYNLVDESTKSEVTGY